MAENPEQISGRLREERRSSNTIDQSLLNRSSLGSEGEDSEKDEEPEQSSEPEKPQDQAKNESVPGEVDNNSSQPGEDYANLREEQTKARVEQAEKETGKSKESADDKSSSPLNPVSKISKATAGILKDSWMGLVESFGLTLLYIDLHFLLNMILGDKMFCKLGHEWVPAEIEKFGGKRAEMLGKKIEVVETGGCCAINGCLLMLLLISFAPIILLIWVVVHPVDALAYLGTMIYNLFKSIL